MELFKYQAAGNDFILLRSLDRRAELPEQEIIRLCDRRYGSSTTTTAPPA